MAEPATTASSSSATNVSTIVGINSTITVTFVAPTTAVPFA